MNKVACVHCDLLVDSIELESNEHAECPRCEQTLYISKQSMRANSAILITTLLLFFPAILLPFIQLEVKGKTQVVSLIGSILNIAQGHMIILAIAIFLLVILLPLTKSIGLLAITYSLSQKKLPFFSVDVTKIIIKLIPWGMLEVYLIGALVTTIKLVSITDVSFLIGFWLFSVIIILNAVVSLVITKRQIWQHISTIKKSKPLNQH